MLKPILSIIGGVILTFALVFATDALFRSLSSSPPAGMDHGAYIGSQSLGALLVLLIGWAVAVFVGAAVSSRFGGRGEWPGWVVIGLFLLATLPHFLMISHPLWLVVPGLALPIVAGWFGSRIGVRPARSASV